MAQTKDIQVKEHEGMGVCQMGMWASDPHGRVGGKSQWVGAQAKTMKA